MKTIRKWYFVIGVLFLLFLLIFAIDFYFLSRLSAQEQRIHFIKQVNQVTIVDLSSNLSVLILNVSKKIDQLSPVVLNPNPKSNEIRKNLIKSFRPKKYKDVESVWSTANSVSMQVT